MKYFLSLCILFLCSCFAPQQPKLINAQGRTIRQRILLPKGFTRKVYPDSSFATFLQNVALLPDGEKVHYFDGGVKEHKGVYVAVIDMNTGKSDLQQCADVVMHMRAAYLYTRKQRSSISFTFTSGFVAQYSKWMAGYRISVKGNNAEWVKQGAPADSSETFLEYLDVIYRYCGSLSLSRELLKINYKDIQPGDVLIKGGTPGHAELIMDVAEECKGHKIYLLAQGYMPSQQMQLLVNPNNRQLSPWYELALIKVKLEGLSPLIVSEDKNPEIGIDVWAIGTPSSLDLGQTVSKGIVSGIRKTNGLTMLQIDAKISPGNSGGALINKDGTVLGIVSSKLIGYGTEGIGFAISSAEVLQSLNIRYK